jgi:hypothetical protein
MVIESDNPQSYTFGPPNSLSRGLKLVFYVILLSSHYNDSFPVVGQMLRFFEHDNDSAALLRSRKRLAAKHDGHLAASITVARLYKICLRTAQLFTESAGNGSSSVVFGQRLWFRIQHQYFNLFWM